MAVIPLATLPAPELDYLSKSDLATWLRRQLKEVDALIKAGVIMDGKVRPGKRMKTWSREDAAVNRYWLDHLERVAGGLEAAKAAMPKTADEEEE